MTASAFPAPKHRLARILLALRAESNMGGAPG